jgi:TatD DNase family protein
MIDSHCHLAGDEFADDLDLVIARAQDAGVQGALCILDAGNRVELDRVAGLRARWADLRFSVGVHPHRAAACGTADEVERLVRQVVADSGACAIGEVGLDYHYDFAPRDVQQAIFGRQVELACALDLPLVIHTREADADTLAVLRAAGGGRARGVLHCFTGDAALATEALAIGFHVSFSGIVTFPRADALREVAAALPHDRVLIETDSPYLAPVPFRGRRNEPAWVGRVAETLAQVWGMSVAEVERQTTATFDTLFAAPAGRTAHDGSR